MPPLSRTYSNLRIIINNQTEDTAPDETVKVKRLEDELKCPSEREAKFELFPLTCNKNHDCVQALGSNFRCCKLFGGQRCHEGLEMPLEDIEHEREFIHEFKAFESSFSDNFLKNLQKFYVGF